MVHQVLALNILNLAVLPPLASIPQRKQYTPRTPRELVSQRVVRRLRRRQPTTVAQEARNLAPLLMNLVNRLNSVQVINTRVQTNLVHDRDTGILGLLVKLLHRRGNIAGGDDVLLVADGGLDDEFVVCVGDKRDGDIDLGDFRIEGGAVINVERNGVAVGETLAELGGALKCSAGDGDVDVGFGEDSCCGPGGMSVQRED